MNEKALIMNILYFEYFTVSHKVNNGSISFAVFLISIMFKSGANEFYLLLNGQ